MGEWRPIPGHPRYEVSDDGQVRAWQEPGWRGCIHHDGRWILLKQATGGRVHNYKRVRLHRPERHAYVHHLVAEAFLGPRPEGAMVLHLNDNGFDNRLANLRYGDRDENELDRHVARVAPALEASPF